MRMLIFVWTLAVVCGTSCTGVQQTDRQNQTALEGAVLLVQARRFAAMIAVDTVELASILAPDLTYTHTMGDTETKAQFLATLRSRWLKYESIEPDSVQVRIYRGTAVVTGRSAMQIIAGDRALSFEIRFIEVYQWNEGRWQLLAWQSTRLPES